MNGFVYGMARAAIETFPLPEPIVEVGSLQVENQSANSNLRPLFAGKKFVGIDMRPGPGVDRVENVERLSFPDRSVGTVVALNIFEHVERFWLGFREIERVLRDDGAVLISVPFHFKIHAYPSDYWRFTPAALDSLLVDYPQRMIGRQGSAKRPSSVWTLAGKRDYPHLNEENRRAFAARLKQYGKEPYPWWREWLCRIGSLVHGKKPFEACLARENFACELRGGKVTGSPLVPSGC